MSTDAKSPQKKALDGNNLLITGCLGAILGSGTRASSMGHNQMSNELANKSESVVLTDMDIVMEFGLREVSENVATTRLKSRGADMMLVLSLLPMLLLIALVSQYPQNVVVSIFAVANLVFIIYATVICLVMDARLRNAINDDFWEGRL